MTSKLQKIPQTCPRHPDDSLVRTDVRKIYQDIAQPPTLTQHRCAQGCETPLGWLYQGWKGEIRTGPGLCSDPQVLFKMSADEYENTTFQYIAAAVSIPILFAFLAFFIPALAYEIFWSTAHTITAVTLGLAAVGAVAKISQVRKSGKPVLREQTNPN